MTKERFEWVLAGIDFDRLNRAEMVTVAKIQRDFETKGLSARQDEMLESLYRRKFKTGGF